MYVNQLNALSEDLVIINHVNMIDNKQKTKWNKTSYQPLSFQTLEVCTVWLVTWCLSSLGWKVFGRPISLNSEKCWRISGKQMKKPEIFGYFP